MANIKLGDVFKKALAIEDSEEVGEMYRDFFESEGLALDLMSSVVEVNEAVIEKYDLLICDWVLGRGTAKDWLIHMQQLNKLPKAVVIVTGMADLESEFKELPGHIIYKPFDFSVLKEAILQFK